MRSTCPPLPRLQLQTQICLSFRHEAWPTNAAKHSPYCSSHWKGAFTPKVGYVCLFANLWVTDIPDRWVQSLFSKMYKMVQNCSFTFLFLIQPEPPLVLGNSWASTSKRPVQRFQPKPVHCTKAQWEILALFLSLKSHKKCLKNSRGICKVSNFLWDKWNTLHRRISKMPICMFL